MFRKLLGCACAALGLAAAAVGQAAITQEGGVSITPGIVQVGISPQTQPQGPTGDGQLWITEPSVLASATLNIGTPQGPPAASGVVYVQGGTTSQTEGVYVGRGGNGRLEVTDGGVVTSNIVRIGGDLNTTPASPQGIAQISGVGSTLRYLDLAVGASSDGQLHISGGGAAMSYPATTAPPVNIGRTFGSTGLATVDGVGSVWQHAGDINVGNAGPGTLRMTNGGVVASNGGRVGGEAQSSFGSVAIDGAGSRWTVTNLSLATQSSMSFGEILVANGGMLENAPQGPRAVIGTNGYGRIVVNGPTSRWIHPGTPQLGGTNSGTGEVFLENGTQFTSNGVDMAQGSGRFVVSGPTTRWTSMGTIALGKGQNRSSVELLDGATLSLPTGAFVDIGANGRLILDGGRILSPSTRFAFTNSGVVEGSGVIQSSGATNHGRVLVGPGERLQIMGTLTHSPTGVIEVNGGELEMGKLESSLGSRVIASGATLRATVAGTAGIPWNSKGAVTFADGRNRVFGTYANIGTTVVASGAEAEFYDQVNNLGTMSVAAGGTLTMFGTLGLRGVGGAGEVYLEGAVQPAGAMAFGGDLFLGGASRLEIGLNGVVHDSLEVSGSLSLSGALQLTAIGQLPLPSMTLTIAQGGELSGVFSSLPAIGSTIGAGVRFHGVTYDYAHDEVLVALTQGLEGDLNLDGQLSGLDFLAWQRASGSACEPGLGADANCDGVIDGADLAVWRSAMAAAAAAQGAVQTAVPEPASWGVMGIAVVAILNTHRRRC